MINSTMAATAGKPTKANTTDTSRVPHMLFIDDKGLEEEFLTENFTINATLLRFTFMLYVARTKLKILIEYYFTS